MTDEGACHGTTRCYRAGCRLPECREANAAYMRGWRGGGVFHAAEHGTRSKYRAGCRCDDCKEACRVYMAEYRALIRDRARRKGTRR